MSGPGFDWRCPKQYCPPATTALKAVSLNPSQKHAHASHQEGIAGRAGLPNSETPKTNAAGGHFVFPVTPIRG